MSTMLMLPESWINEIFARLTGIFGHRFTNAYASGVQTEDGLDSGLESAKRIWREELAGFADNPQALHYALKNLDPKFPPSALEFRDAARRAPPPEHKQLTFTPTEADLARGAQVIHAAASALRADVHQDGLDWARHPASTHAWYMIKSAAKRYPAYAEVVKQLEADGVVVDGHLAKRWNGQDWERV